MSLNIDKIMKPYFGVGNVLDSTFLLRVKPTSPTHRAESGCSQPHGNPLSIVHITAQRGAHPRAKERVRWSGQRERKCEVCGSRCKEKVEPLFDSSKIDLHNVVPPYAHISFAFQLRLCFNICKHETTGYF